MLHVATGSGGFLVEAARRVVDAVIEHEPRDIEEGLAAISAGLHGCEISPAERADRAALDDRRFGLVPLDAEKSAAYDHMTRPEFAFVVGNPPYVFESGNRALFARLRELPGWKETYRGKGDYLCYFLALAEERLASGGRLAVIVPAGGAPGNVCRVGMAVCVCAAAVLGRGAQRPGEPGGVPGPANGWPGARRSNPGAARQPRGYGRIALTSGRCAHRRPGSIV